jgi:hypothetical protein
MQLILRCGLPALRVPVQAIMGLQSANETWRLLYQNLHVFRRVLAWEVEFCLPRKMVLSSDRQTYGNRTETELLSSDRAVD